MRILISGGAGFIGSHLIKKVLEQDFEVILLKKSTSNTWRVKKYFQKIKTHDIENDNFEDIFKNNSIDIVIHLAAKYIKFDKSDSEKKKLFETNVVFANKLLEASIKNGVKGFINTGSFFEYQKTNKLISENSVKNPFNYYAKTKILFEERLRKSVDGKKIRGITLTPFSPYGEKDNRAVIYLMIKALIKNEPLELGSGKQRLSFSYVGDIADAYIKTIEHISSSNYYNYQNFNIGISKAHSISEIGSILKKISDNKNYVLRFDPANYPNSEITQALCDNSKAKKILFWNPKTAIDDGLEKTYRYWAKRWGSK